MYPPKRYTLPPRNAYVHFLNLQTRYRHAIHDIRKQGHHIVVAHSHVRDDLLERNLLRGMILILFTAAIKLLSQLCDLALLSTKE